jgi:pilus assembly protein TadC
MATIALFAVGMGAVGLASSALLGGAVGLLTWEIGRILAEPRKDLTLTNLLEQQRRTILRQRSKSYRMLEPLIDRLEPYCRALFARRLPDLQLNLEMVEPQTPWLAAEYLVLKVLEALPVVLFVAVLVSLMFSAVVGLFLLGMGVLILPVLVRRRVADLARRYRISVRNRLPFLVDLMALMLESGAIFRECLETAAAENRDHAIGDEFGRVCRAIDQGVPQQEALRGLGRRIDDTDVYEMVFAINTAEERGTRLKDTLRNLAEQMRQRRIQWLEKAAEEAKIHITWPGMLIMLACLLIVAAPMLLSALGAAGR